MSVDGLVDATKSVYAVGVSAGAKNTSIVSINDIATLNPSRMVNASKSTRLVVPGHMIATGWTDQTVLTVYCMATADNCAALRITYDFEFDSPHK